MNMASSNVSSSTWTSRNRQPVFLATLVSVGFHGLVFAAVPLLSQEDNALEEPESVGVVELTAEELARLPDFAQRDALNMDNFGSSPVTQGGLPLPVPGEVPIGEEDFTNFDGGFLGMLPPVTLEGSGSLDSGDFELDDFSSTSSTLLDPFGNGSISAGPDLPISGDPFSVLPLPPAAPLPSGGSVNFPPAPPENPGDDSPLDVTAGLDTELNEALLDPTLPPTEFDAEGNPILPTPPAEPAEVAVNTNGSQDERPPETEGDAGDLVVPPGPEPEGEAPGEASEPEQSIPATLSPAEEDLLARREELRAINRKYRPDGTAALGDGEAADRIIALQAETEAQLKQAQTVVLTLPEDFPQCETEVRMASFAVTVDAEGVLSSFETIQGTGFPALDEIAEAELRARAAALSGGMDPISETPVPALYSLDVEFIDPPSGCQDSALS